jgi:hypothetical protein
VPTYSFFWSNIPTFFAPFSDLTLAAGQIGYSPAAAAAAAQLSAASSASVAAAAPAAAAASLAAAQAAAAQGAPGKAKSSLSLGLISGR